ncbi:MAG: hypothetical protein ACREXJ_00190 [Gammaproteobacteria bacterium]
MAHNLLAGALPSAAQWNALATHLGVYKTTDTTRSSTTTLAADPHLTLDIDANAVYLLTFRAAVQSPAAADLKWDWSLPASATMHHYTYAVTGGTGSFTPATSSITLATTGGADGVIIYGTIITGATAGNVTWRWAQAVSDAGSTIVLAGASLHLIRIA